MRRKIGVLTTALLTGISVLSLTACGGEYIKETGKENVSGGAVSGAAVEVKECAMSEELYCYHTDTNLYCDDINYISQFRLDGTKKKKIKIEEFGSLLSVDSNYIYYKTEKENEEDIVVSSQICRAPIEKDKAGYDVVKVENAEILIEDDIKIWGVCADANYIFYQRHDTGTVVKYDVQKRKQVSIDELPLEEYDEIEFLCGGTQVWATCGEEGVFVHDLDGTTWTKISEDDIYWDVREWNETALFYSYSGGELPVEISKCDLTEMTESTFVSSKQLRKAAMEVAGLDSSKKETIDVCAVTDLFWQEERLYIQIQLNWSEKDTYHVEYMIFSTVQEKASLRYEKELTECMRTYAENKVGEWKRWEHTETEPQEWVVEENMIWNAAKCYCMTEGKAFYCMYDKKEEKWRVGCCELSTGKFRWLTKKDAEYYEPCYIKPHNDWRDICFFSEMGEYYNPEKTYDFTRMDWGPDWLDDKRGGFYETNK